MIIAVTGTPGTGKTTLAKALAKKLGVEYVDVNRIIKDNKLSEGIDRERGCRIVDTKKLNKVLLKKIKGAKGLVIDSHLSHYLPKKDVDLCIVAKCGLKTLERRLKKRRYSQKKIRENLDCEIFEVCRNEAIEAGHKVLDIDCTKRLRIKELVKHLLVK